MHVTNEDAEGVSPTEREFDKATEEGNHRIIFVKRCSGRNPKEAKFIKRVEEQIVRKGFNDFEELRTSVYSSLIRFLEDNEYLRFLPWDASLHRTATLDDIDREKVKSFVALAKEKRGFPLDYSDFFGGALVKSSHFEEVKAALEAKKAELNLKNEIKWVKVTENYLQKYMEIIDLFFTFIEQGKVKVRIMFRETEKCPSDLSKDKIDNRYSLLYYQFVKNAFGLCHRDKEDGDKVFLRIYFDEIPYPLEQRDAFKSHILSLQKFWQFRKAGIKIRMDDIAEIISGKHSIQQCMDIVLGSMAFMLNKHNEDIPEGQTERGKRTIAKENLFYHILCHIRSLKGYENFQIYCDTPAEKPVDYWKHPYRHWSFLASEFVKQ